MTMPPEDDFMRFFNEALARVEAAEAARNEFEPHVIVTLDRDLITATGPYRDVHVAMRVADHAGAVLNEGVPPDEEPCRLVVVPLYPPHQEFSAEPPR